MHNQTAKTLYDSEYDSVWIKNIKNMISSITGGTDSQKRKTNGTWHWGSSFLEGLSSQHLCPEVRTDFWQECWGQAVHKWPFLIENGEECEQLRDRIQILEASEGP